MTLSDAFAWDILMRQQAAGVSGDPWRHAVRSPGRWAPLTPGAENSGQQGFPTGAASVPM